MYARKIHVTISELRELMRTESEEEHPLETLETLLEVKPQTTFLMYVRSYVFI